MTRAWSPPELLRELRDRADDPLTRALLDQLPSVYGGQYGKLRETLDEWVQRADRLWSPKDIILEPDLGELAGAELFYYDPTTWTATVYGLLPIPAKARASLPTVTTTR